MTTWGFGIVQAQEVERAGLHVFEELCELLSEGSGVSFQPVIAESYRELIHAIEDDEVGLAWLPPIPAIELEERRLTTVLAIPLRNGGTTYHSALVARRGSRTLQPKADPASREGLEATIAELRGRRAVWVQKDSAAGYLVPRMQLASHGVDVLRYFSRELFVHSHPAVIDAVVSGEADVGATYCHVEARRPTVRPGSDPGSDPSLASQASKSDVERARVVRGAWLDESGRATRPIEVLATFGPIPNDALVAATGLPIPARSALTRWLLDARPRPHDLFAKLIGSGDFRMPSAAHYDPLRHLLRAARARGHDAMPSSSRTGIRIPRRP